MDLDGIEEKLGFSFENRALLEQALTHRSYGLPHNERLEFLGDSVLNCVIAQVLYERFPDIPEGDLSRVRANLVNQQSLYELATNLVLGDFIKLGQGELKSGGTQRPSILADGLEAIFGAILVDGGFDSASTVIRRVFEPVLAALDPAAVAKDPKTRLQEYLQGKRLPLPTYTIIEVAGEAHDQLFRVECVVAETGIRTEGSGGSRRAAEQDAARQAYALVAGRQA